MEGGNKTRNQEGGRTKWDIRKKRNLLWADKEGLGRRMDVHEMPVQKKQRRLPKKSLSNGTQRNTEQKHKMSKMPKGAKTHGQPKAAPPRMQRKEGRKKRRTKRGTRMGGNMLEKPHKETKKENEQRGIYKTAKRGNQKRKSKRRK